MPRHKEGIHAVYLDFSVRHIDIKQLWTIKWHRNCEIPGRYTLAMGFGGDDWPEWLRKYKDY